MLVLFETSAGYALFAVKNDGKLEDVKNLYKEFESIDKAKKLYVVTRADSRGFRANPQARARAWARARARP